MMLFMRTTVTLDDDTAALVRQRMRERDIGFKQALNELLREAALSDADWTFRTPTFAMGRPRVDLTKANQVAAELEDEQLLRQMERDG